MTQISKAVLKISNKQILLILIIGTFFVSIIPFQSAYSVGFFFDDIKNVSNTPDIFSGSAQVAVSGSEVYVVWIDSDGSGNDDVLFAKSIDGGDTFGTPVNLSDNPGSSSLPQISVSGSNVYVIWSDNEGESDSEIFFSRSTDGVIIF